MATTLSTGDSIFIAGPMAEEAVRVSQRVNDRKFARFVAILDDGEQLELPSDLSDLIAGVLNGVAHGSVQVQRMPEELSTTAAAGLLGISRPTLMKWLHSGELASHKVGSHHRLKTDDVIAFSRQRRERRNKAFEALREWDESLEEI